MQPTKPTETQVTLPPQSGTGDPMGYMAGTESDAFDGFDIDEELQTIFDQLDNNGDPENAGS